LAGYDALLTRFGTMSFKETFARAAQVAEEGWGLAERRHSDVLNSVKGLNADADSQATFLDGTNAPPLYGIIRNPNLAKALRLLQAQGKDAFYKGPIADAIVAKVKAGGGVMSHDDLASYAPEWVEPITTNYHGYDIFQLPPPGQGFAALEMLNILEVCMPKLGVNLAALGPSDPTYWHMMVEAKKLAYADQLATNGDPKFAPVPWRSSSRRHAATLCRKIDPGKRRRADAPAAWTAARSSRPPIAGATWCRSCTACSASTAAAPPWARTVSCCTTAAAPSRSIPDTRTSWRRASGRSTASSPAS
jgi:gamma-glutamyltranspeptidase/glutathione hydrolase